MSLNTILTAQSEKNSDINQHRNKKMRSKSLFFYNALGIFD